MYTKTRSNQQKVCILYGSDGIYGTGCNFEGGGVRVSLGKITKIRAFPHPVPYKPPDPMLHVHSCTLGTLKLIKESQ